MKDLELKKRFIVLRALEKSLSTIAEELGVSRQTLANWERAYALEINNLKAMELDALQEVYWMKEQGRIKLLGETLRSVREEVKRRDLSDVPTVKLIELELKLSAKLAAEFSTPNIQSEQELARRRALSETMMSMRTFLEPEPAPLLVLASERQGKGTSRKRSADAN